jgi:hypothetical protein
MQSNFHQNSPKMTLHCRHRVLDGVKDSDFSLVHFSFCRAHAQG